MSDPVERLASKVRVRPLDADDSLAHLTGLLHRAYKQHADMGIKALAAFQPEAVTRQRISVGECYVATYLGKVVGTILFKSAPDTARAGVVGTGSGGGGNSGGVTRIAYFDRGDVASFSQFAVEPEVQGRGIGSVLMQTAERRAAQTGAAHLGLSTPEPATWLVQMYQRHGYQIVERVHWNETNYVSAIMAKPIPAPTPATGSAVVVTLGNQADSTKR